MGILLPLFYYLKLWVLYAGNGNIYFSRVVPNCGYLKIQTGAMLTLNRLFCKAVGPTENLTVLYLGVSLDPATVVPASGDLSGINYHGDSDQKGLQPRAVPRPAATMGEPTVLAH